MSWRDRLAPLGLAVLRRCRPLLPTPPGAFRILLFHDIPPGQRPAFAALVEDLARRNRLLSPGEAEARLNQGGPPASGPPPVLLSFDDGFASNAEVARTVLDPLGAKALFFVCPGLMALSGAAQAEAVGRNVLRGRKPAPEPLMDWGAVEHLAANGHGIGNHTLDHLRLSALSADARAEQVEGAAAILASRLGASAPWFAYTFGDIDSIDADSLKLVGRHHRYCRSGIRGVNGGGTPPLALRADHVDLEAAPAWRHLAMEGGLDLAYGAKRRRLDALAAQ